MIFLWASLKNAVLASSLDHPIVDLTFKQTEMVPDVAEDKLTRLDVACVLDTGEFIDVEVQVLNYRNMRKRTLFYWAQMYRSSLKPGDTYQELKPCYAINIMQFDLVGGDNPHSMFSIYNEKTGERLNKDMELHFIEIPKYKKRPGKTFRTMTKMERWLAYFANRLEIEKKEEILMAEPAIADVFLMNEDDRWKYINREMAILDYRSEQRYWNEEREKNKAEIKKLEKVLDESRDREREETLARAVVGMLEKKIPVDTVAEISGWSEEKVRAFGKQHDLL